MLNCDLCDYYKIISNDENTGEGKAAFCEFSGFIFTKDLWDLDMEYPCRNISYEEYLQRLQKESAMQKDMSNDRKLVHTKSNNKPDASVKKISA